MKPDNIFPITEEQRRRLLELERQKKPKLQPVAADDPTQIYYAYLGLLRQRQL